MEEPEPEPVGVSAAPRAGGIGSRHGGERSAEALDFEHLLAGAGALPVSQCPTSSPISSEASSTREQAEEAGVAAQRPEQRRGDRAAAVAAAEGARERSARIRRGRRARPGARRGRRGARASRGARRRGSNAGRGRAERRSRRRLAAATPSECVLAGERSHPLELLRRRPVENHDPHPKAPPT